MAIDPLWLLDGRVIESEFLAVSYTRHLTTVEDGVTVVLDGVEAARRQPSAVDLRLDVRSVPVLSDEEKERIISFLPLRADRRGVVRMGCGEFESRPKNLAAARERMAMAIADALERPLEPATTARPKRGRVGLLKRNED